MSVVQAGDLVRIHYTTRASDGVVVETSRQREPLEFVAGSPAIVPGVSHGVIGMSVGEKRRLSVGPDQAFGRRDPQWQQWAPVAMLPDRVREGDQLSLALEGERIDVWVQKQVGSQVLIDANHPLSGEYLVYEIEVLARQEA